MKTVGGRYAIEGPLGSGRLFRARHQQLGTQFALELVAPPFAGDEAGRVRFRENAKLASDVIHPSIVPVVDFGEDPEVGAYIVTELVEGAPLIAPGGVPFSPRRAFDILTQLASAVEHLHRRGIIHGALAATRVIIATNPDGGRIIKLLDLGVSTRQAADPEPHYLAPERVGGEPPAIGSDVYALGVIGYLMLAGRFPFEGTTAEVLRAQLDQRPPPLAAMRGEPVDPAIEAVIARALAKHPDERHRSAAALRFELDLVADKLAVERRRISTSGLTQPENPRDATVLLVFEHGGVAQAVITPAGTIAVANRAFGRLLGHTKSIEGFEIAETAIVDRVPDLLRTIRTVQRTGTSVELHAGDLTVWVSPFSSEAVHVIVRVEPAVS